MATESLIHSRSICPLPGLNEPPEFALYFLMKHKQCVTSLVCLLILRGVLIHKILLGVIMHVTPQSEF